MKTHNARRLSLLAATLAFGAFGCSSTPASPSRSGVDESAALPTLSDGDRAKLCDWIASQAGGYGHTTTATCDGGLLLRATFVEDQATCTAKLTGAPACTATVSEMEDCIRAEVAAGPCVLSEATPAACQPLHDGTCPGI